MTTPDPRGNTEYFGTIEVYGIPFSTFTRSIVMGLEEFGITKKYYMQQEVPPHSGEVKKRNPFGLLPVFVHRPDAIYTKKEEAVTLFESNAIRRYIDEYLGPQANKILNGKHILTPKDNDGSHMSVARRAKVDQWISLASNSLFSAVELGVVKPRLSMEANEADDQTITLAIQAGLDRLHDRLAIFEEMLDQSEGDWCCGKDITWADLFMYPALADLRAVPEGQVIRGADAVFPRLSTWLDKMQERQSAKATYEGTLASQRD
jgi:glutathione S-transferase